MSVSPVSPDSPDAVRGARAARAACPLRPGQPCTACHPDAGGPQDCPIVALVMDDEELRDELARRRRA